MTDENGENRIKATTKEERMFCDECGAELDSEDEVCPECDATVKPRETDGYKEGVC